MDKLSMSHLISFSRYQTKFVIKFSFRQLKYQVLRFIVDQPVQNWLTGNKEGEDENTKTWTSRKRKEFFRWNQKHFP